MAKEKNTLKILSWEDVNRYLKLKGECEISIDTIEAEMNLKINDAKSEADKLAKPLKDKVKEIEEELASFTEEHKAEIEGRTKELTFGRVGFRIVNSVTVPSKKLDKIIENLKKFGMEKCIDIKETVNKNILATYSDKDIAKVGASKKVADKFWCEADREKVRG